MIIVVHFTVLCFQSSGYNYQSSQYGGTNPQTEKELHLERLRANVKVITDISNQNKVLRFFCGENYMLCTKWRFGPIN